MSAPGADLVIGYGNSLRGDDGAGPFVASQMGHGAIVCHQLTPELAEPISQARRVVFVDAQMGLAPGEVAVHAIEPRRSALIHRFDPAGLLACAESLYGHAPQAWFAGLGGASYNLGEGLSPEARRAARRAIRTIRRLLANGHGNGRLS